MACDPQIVRDIMTIEPENVTAFCTGARPEMEAAAAEIWNSTAPTSPETLHGDQMGAFAHSVSLPWHACMCQACIVEWLRSGAARRPRRPRRCTATRWAPSVRLSWRACTLQPCADLWLM